MKKLFLGLLLSLLFIPKSISQTEDIINSVASQIIAVSNVVLSIKQMEAQAEHTATEWILNNYPNLTNFSLKTLDFENKKVTDMSDASVITYTIQEFVPGDNPKVDGKKYILFGFTSTGWISDYGINFNRVLWYLVDSDEWMNMMTAYVKTASSEENDSFIKETLLNGKIVNRGVRVRSSLTIPFYKMSRDLYAVTDYNNLIKLVYNERSLGIYLKETSNLVQIGRNKIINIHDFFFEN